MGTDVWNEMSFRFYMNRKNERELDFYELENTQENYEDNIKIKTSFYGLYENLMECTTFGVEDIFYLNYEE